MKPNTERRSAQNKYLRMQQAFLERESEAGVVHPSSEGLEDGDRRMPPALLHLGSATASSVRRRQSNGDDTTENTHLGEVLEALHHAVHRKEARAVVPELFLLLWEPITDVSLPIKDGHPEKGNSRFLQPAGRPQSLGHLLA